MRADSAFSAPAASRSAALAGLPFRRSWRASASSSLVGGLRLIGAGLFLTAGAWPGGVLQHLLNRGCRVQHLFPSKGGKALCCMENFEITEIELFCTSRRTGFPRRLYFALLKPHFPYAGVLPDGLPVVIVGSFPSCQGHLQPRLRWRPTMNGAGCLS